MNEKKPRSFLRGFRLRGEDLNLRPSGYEPDELPGCSTARQLGGGKVVTGAQESRRYGEGLSNHQTALKMARTEVRFAAVGPQKRATLANVVGEWRRASGPSLGNGAGAAHAR
jgi:hypothetical protein